MPEPPPEKRSSGPTPQTPSEYLAVVLQSHSMDLNDHVARPRFSFIEI
jgi:hypothetical protein